MRYIYTFALILCCAHLMAQGLAPATDGTNDVVVALAVDGSGNLFAGGYFTDAGGITANRVAKWDGTMWDSLGSGMDGPVFALAVDAAGIVYAGGSFTTAGGVTANNVAQWDGSNWTALDTGVNDDVNALAIDADGNLYAGGAFTQAGGASANYIARWNPTGGAWDALGSGTVRAVSALASAPNGDLFVGLEYAPNSHDALAKWNGTSWIDPGTSEFYNIAGLAVTKRGVAFAGGGSHDGPGDLVARQYSGDPWYGTDVLTPEIFDVAAGPSPHAVSEYDVYVGGRITAVGGTALNNVANVRQINDVLPLGSGTDGPVVALAVDGSGNMYAGGAFSTAGGVPANNVARWNGTWSALPFSGASLHVRAFLEGPYTEAGMSTSLNDGDHLPLRDAFRVTGTDLDYDPGGPSLISLPDSMVDWVLVSLRTGTDPGTEVTNTEHAALLHEFGTITTPGQDSLLFPGVADGSYYLVVRHRNHVDVMSASAITVTDGVGSYDFTTPAGKAYGSDAQKLLAPDTWGLYSGDSNIDGLVQTLDREDYLFWTQWGAWGYLRPDFNFDTFVQALDFNLYVANAVAGASSQVP